MPQENFENPSFNFNIENTMEMGTGSQELLQGLLSPETSTADPGEIEPIQNDPSEGSSSQAPVKKTAASSAPPKEKEQGEGEDDAEKSSKKSLLSFLEGDDEDEEESDDAPSNSQSKKPVDKKEDEEGEKDSDEGGEETSQFEALSKDLFKLGVFSKDDDEEDVIIKTPEEFLERFQEEKKKGAIEMVNSFIGQFGEDYQKAFDAIFVKGVEPKEYFGTYNSIVSFAEMDLSQEANQVSVIKQALSDQGFEPEDIETEVERLKNYGDLETVATKHHKVLVKKEAAKLQNLEKQAELEQQQKLQIRNEYYKNVQGVLEEKLKQKEFDGIPLNPKLVNELQDFLLVDRYRTSSGETLTEFDRTILELKRPENHEKKVKIGLLLKILEKDPTLSTIQKTGVTKKSNQLFGEVARQVKKETTKSAQSQKPNSWFT